jgi:hypothetical protein
MGGTLPLPLRLEGSCLSILGSNRTTSKMGSTSFLRCHGLPQAGKMSRSMPGSPFVQRPTKSSCLFSAVSVRRRRKKPGRSARLPIFWTVEFTWLHGPSTTHLQKASLTQYIDVAIQDVHRKEWHGVVIEGTMWQRDNVRAQIFRR